MTTESRLTSQPDNCLASGTSQSIEWYGEGQSRIVEVNGIEIAVRYVSRKGRRSRIAITAPAGAVFRAAERDQSSSVE
jgi:hypothetical protein